MQQQRDCPAVLQTFVWLWLSGMPMALYCCCPLLPATGPSPAHPHAAASAAAASVTGAGRRWLRHSCELLTADCPPPGHLVQVGLLECRAAPLSARRAEEWPAHLLWAWLAAQPCRGHDRQLCCPASCQGDLCLLLDQKCAQAGGAPAAASQQHVAERPSALAPGWACSGVLLLASAPSGMAWQLDFLWGASQRRQGMSDC